MKIISSVLFLLLFLTSTAFAEKQEWYDKNYDFTKVKRIIVNFVIPEQLKNGVVEHEATELFKEQFSKRLVPKLSKQNIKIVMFEDVFQEIKSSQNIDLFALYETDADKARAFIAEYIPKNFDVVCNVTLQHYSMGTEYVDGYTYTTPTSQSYYDGTKFVTVSGTQQHYVSGGNKPAAYAIVKYEITDIPTTKNVWTRIDDRARVNKDIFENSKPKDLYQRSLKSYFSDLASKLTPKK